MKKPTDEQLAAHPEIQEMMDDVGKATAITVVAKSEGGKIIVDGLTADIIGTVETLCAKYSTLTLQEFVGHCADMKSKRDLLLVLTRAPKNKKGLETLIEETLQS